jgi:hypothetical protein
LAISCAGSSQRNGRAAIASIEAIDSRFQALRAAAQLLLRVIESVLALVFVPAERRTTGEAEGLDLERLWGLMHRHITHNTCHATFRQFSEAVLTFLREEVSRKWQTYCDEVTDNFRITSPQDFRVLA